MDSVPLNYKSKQPCPAYVGFFFFVSYLIEGIREIDTYQGQPVIKPDMCFLANFGTCFKEEY